MALAEVPEEAQSEACEPGSLGAAELAAELMTLRAALSGAECRWLLLLAEFDRREGWQLDGQLSCTDWLVWRCGLARSTAREKLRVAHELGRRPAVRDAFTAGRLSYSKVRAITRIQGADTALDAWLLRLADAGTADDLERVARQWEQLRAQERGVEDYLARYDRRAVRVSRTFDGMIVIEAVLPAEDGEEVLAALRAVADQRPVPVDDASAEAPGTAPRVAQQRADALVTLARLALAGAPADPSGGADRYSRAAPPAPAMGRCSAPLTTPSCTKGASPSPATPTTRSPADDPTAPSSAPPGRLASWWPPPWRAVQGGAPLPRRPRPAPIQGVRPLTPTLLLPSGPQRRTVRSDRSCHTKEGPGVSVYKIIELVGTSSQSWEDAAANAVKVAKESLRDLRVAEVVQQDLDIGDGDTVTFRTKLRLSFKYEGGH